MAKPSRDFRSPVPSFRRRALQWRGDRGARTGAPRHPSPTEQEGPVEKAHSGSTVHSGLVVDVELATIVKSVVQGRSRPRASFASLRARSPRRRPSSAVAWLLATALAAVSFGCRGGGDGGQSARTTPASAPSPGPIDVASVDDGAPYLVVLGIAQDGGVPQAGREDHPGWDDPAWRRHVVSVGLVDPRDGGRRYLFEATPDLPNQLHRLSAHLRPDAQGPVLDGVFLTHGHVGHYTGLLFLGFEVIGARSVPVHAMPRMIEYLSTNGPWDQLVRYQNVALQPLADSRPVALASDLEVTPFLVPHRQEYTEVVGYRIDGPSRSALFIPDIDSFEAFDEWGVRIEDLIERVDVAYLDGCFWAQGEIPGRDMTEFPHPMIASSLERFAPLPAAERAKIRFIHLNHTNPVLDPAGPERARVLEAGFGVAEEGERVGL